VTASLRAPSLAVLAVFATLVGLTLGVACRISNEDHCVHKAIDSDAWCAEEVPGKPFCSPCEAAEHGCVAARPDDEDCPEYAPDSSGGATG
jgi:hypothetical protein